MLKYWPLIVFLVLKNTKNILTCPSKCLVFIWSVSAPGSGVLACQKPKTPEFTTEYSPFLVKYILDCPGKCQIMFIWSRLISLVLYTGETMIPWCVALGMIIFSEKLRNLYTKTLSFCFFLVLINTKNILACQGRYLVLMWFISVPGFRVLACQNSKYLNIYLFAGFLAWKNIRPVSTKKGEFLALVQPYWSADTAGHRVSDQQSET
jgi:hypothetical protein